jgi:hypothetical protein
MKLSHALLTTACTLLLTACGGGGGDDVPPPAAATQPPESQPTVSLTEFEGVWKRDAAHDVCVTDFIYNEAYAARVRDVTLTNKGNGVLEVAYAVLVYSDDACTTKQGLVTERFTLDVAQASRAGRDNVIKGVPAFVDGVASSDGGSSITLTAMPDGGMTGLTNVKTIIDVNNGQLQFSTADAGDPVDAEGYPNDFNANGYFVR